MMNEWKKGPVEVGIAGNCVRISLQEPSEIKIEAGPETMRFLAHRILALCDVLDPPKPPRPDGGG